MATNNPFNLTPEQRQEALAKATETRHARAAMIAKVKSGETTFKEFVDSDDKVAARTKVRSLLMAVPGIGAKKRDAIIEAMGLPENRRVGGLGRKQKEQLIELVTEATTPKTAA